MGITSNDGGPVRVLEGRLALDVSLGRSGNPHSLADHVAAFRFLAASNRVDRSRHDGDDLWCIDGGNAEDSSISRLADVPPGSLIGAMESDNENLNAGVDDAYGPHASARPPNGCGWPWSGSLSAGRHLPTLRDAVHSVPGLLRRAVDAEIADVSSG